MDPANDHKPGVDSAFRFLEGSLSDAHMPDSEEEEQTNIDQQSTDGDCTSSTIVTGTEKTCRLQEGLESKS